MIITDAKIIKLLLEKREIVNDGRKADAELRKLTDEQNKRVAKINKIDAKTTELLKKIVNGKLGEWEQPTKFELNKNNEIEVEIVNVIEDFKKKYKEQKNKN